MCTTCNGKVKSKSIDKIYRKLLKTHAIKNCTATEEDIKQFKETLKCIKKSLKFQEYNKYAGLIDSMLNLKDYCRYDLSFISNLAEDYGCYT